MWLKRKLGSRRTATSCFHINVHAKVPLGIPFVSHSHMAVGQKPCTPGEHQNRWKVDVHPPQNGIAVAYAPWPYQIRPKASFATLSASERRPGSWLRWLLGTQGPFHEPRSVNMRLPQPAPESQPLLFGHWDFGQGKSSCRGGARKDMSKLVSRFQNVNQELSTKVGRRTQRFLSPLTNKGIPLVTDQC